MGGALCHNGHTSGAEPLAKGDEHGVGLVIVWECKEDTTCAIRSNTQSPGCPQVIRDEEVLGVGEIWGPFKSEGEWQLVQWLIKNVGHGQAEEFLRLNITDLLDAVDHLPQSVEWKCECITLTGDVRDDDGNAETEELELWFRDPVECVRELIGNPTFKDAMKYAPEHLYTSQEGNNRVINEMWTADWWWDMQVSQ
ncbi:hypothetical protein EDD15DRAFT_2178696 [Pisolithus albus]|nr:hypothetical protein EDD15DRAFT_2178696 [Pisolithus albus]